MQFQTERITKLRQYFQQTKVELCTHENLICTMATVCLQHIVLKYGIGNTFSQVLKINV